MWTTCYTQIANCNLYLDEFTGLTFSDYELISDYKQEMFRYNNYQYEVRSCVHTIIFIWHDSMELSLLPIMY